MLDTGLRRYEMIAGFLWLCKRLKLHIAPPSRLHRDLCITTLFVIPGSRDL